MEFNKMFLTIISMFCLVASFGVVSAEDPVAITSGEVVTYTATNLEFDYDLMSQELDSSFDLDVNINENSTLYLEKPVKFYFKYRSEIQLPTVAILKSELDQSVYFPVLESKAVLEGADIEGQANMTEYTYSFVLDKKYKPDKKYKLSVSVYDVDRYLDSSDNYKKNGNTNAISVYVMGSQYGKDYMYFTIDEIKDFYKIEDIVCDPTDYGNLPYETIDVSESEINGHGNIIPSGNLKIVKKVVDKNDSIAISNDLYVKDESSNEIKTLKSIGQVLASNDLSEEQVSGQVNIVKKEDGSIVYDVPVMNKKKFLGITISKKIENQEFNAIEE